MAKINLRNGVHEVHRVTLRGKYYEILRSDGSILTAFRGSDGKLSRWTKDYVTKLTADKWISWRLEMGWLLVEK